MMCGPGEVFCYVHPQEFCAADSLHSRAVDGQWGVVNRVPPEVHHNLLCLTHIEGQVVCTTPFIQLCHFLSVGCFIIVADEAYHSCVISKLDDVVGAELGNAVVSQQRAEHTALWGTCAQCGSARGVAADTDWLLTEVFWLESPGSSYRGRHLGPAGLICWWAVVGLLCWMLSWSRWTAF